MATLPIENWAKQPQMRKPQVSLGKRGRGRLAPFSSKWCRPQRTNRHRSRRARMSLEYCKRCGQDLKFWDLKWQSYVRFLLRRYRRRNSQQVRDYEWTVTLFQFWSHCLACQHWSPKCFCKRSLGVWNDNRSLIVIPPGARLQSCWKCREMHHR